MKRVISTLSIFAKQIQVIFLGLFMISLVLVNPFLQTNTNELILLSCLCLSFLFIISCSSKLIYSFSFRINDLAILIYILYNIILLALSEHSIDPIYWFEWWGAILLYMIARNIIKIENIIFFIVISAVIQALYGLGQHYGLFYSNHSYFPITGSFLNPGPFAGYLSVGFILSFILFFIWKRKWVKYTCGILSIIIGVGILLSDSRAAWLSIIIPSLIYLISRISQKKYRSLCYILGIAVLMGTSLGLFHYKKKSAEARLMIWEITISSIDKHFITGKGLTVFPTEYMYQQAKYFETHPDSNKAQLASNNTHVFNDFLRVLYEQGLIGLLISLWILYNALFMRSNNRPTVFFLKLSFIALLIFSFFSYPSDVLPLKYLVPLFLGFLPGKILVHFSPGMFSRNLTKYVSLLLTLPILLSGIVAMRLNSKITELMKDYYFESSENAGKELQELYPFFGNNKELVLKYAKVLFSDEAFTDAVPILERASKISPSSLLLCDLGVAYTHTEQLCKAQQSFIEASYMTPCYILPHYHLFLFYAKQNRIENQVEIANLIDQMTVKIENETTMKIKQEIRLFLESIN